MGMGRLTYQKGFDVLLRAHAALRQRGLHHHLVILGEGPDRPALEGLARELGIEGTTFLPGFVSDPFAALRASRVFALSSRYEGFGMVLAEAMALGVPVVTSDCPSGPGDIVEAGRSGRLVPVDDVDALADAVAPLLADGPAAMQARTGLIAAGSARVEAFAVRTIARAWEDELLAAVAGART
jgi:glycosyltransferase involved in cell wall biosynthesis